MLASATASEYVLHFDEFWRFYGFLKAPHFTLVKEALIEIGCVVGLWSLVGCHARALWPNGAS